MAAAYLMVEYKLTPEDAIKQIQKIRTFIDVTPPQRSALHTFFEEISK
jgi:hypothetical protein